MIEISAITNRIENLFGQLNAQFFNGELTQPAITLSSDNGRGSYGWCTVVELWENATGKYYEINVSSEYINRPISEVCATLLHEMTHLHDITHGIQDVSNNGYYHNKKFKASAEAHGLHIEKHVKYGWTVTTLNDEAAAWVAENIGTDNIDARRLTVNKMQKAKAKKSNSIKYVCPVCGAIVRATRELNIRCDDCDEAFEMEE